MKIYGDHLSRANAVEEISHIIKTCIEMNKSTTFSIEGEWGRGKTWLIDKVQSNISGKDLSKLRKDNSYSLTNKEYLVINYNAWEKDYYEEPLLGILITIINQLNKVLICENTIKSSLLIVYKESKDILESALRSISKRVIGVDVIEIGKKSWGLFNKINKESKIILNGEYSENIHKDIEIVVDILNKLTKVVPIVFIVDELDRCIPSHSIKTLERLHHVFGKVNPSVTIIAINENQLRNTVEIMFGKNIAYESYMRKFIDFRINLGKGEADLSGLNNKLKTYYSLFDNRGDINLQNDIILSLCNYMTAREFEKIYENAIICHNLVNKSTNYFPSDCLVGELFVFACKISKDKEDNPQNIYPNNGNYAKTAAGKYIKEFLKSLKQNFTYDLNDSQNIILYICAECLGLIEQMNLRFNYDDTDKNIIDFYKEYKKYYKFIKI